MENDWIQQAHDDEQKLWTGEQEERPANLARLQADVRPADPCSDFSSSPRSTTAATDLKIVPHAAGLDGADQQAAYERAGLRDSDEDPATARLSMPASKPAFLGNVPEAFRCKAKSSRTGLPCNNPAAKGTRTCRVHGGATWAAKKRATRAKIERSYEDDARRRAREFEPTDAQTVPVIDLEAELRRTVGWIRYFESRVKELSDEQMIWGLTEQELRSAGLRGRDVDAMAAQQKGRIHPCAELLQHERAHLARLLRVLLSHGVQERSLELRDDQIDALQRAIDAVVRGLGRNPADRDVRATILAALRTL